MSKERVALISALIIFLITNITTLYGQSNSLVNFNNSKLDTDQNESLLDNHLQSNEDYLSGTVNYLSATPYFELILGAIIGFFSAIGKDLIQNIIDAPRIKIVDETIEKQFDYKRYSSKINVEDLFIGTRIIVKNKGNTAAENCKAILIINTDEHRISWMLKNSDLTITLNAHDQEYIDLCAISCVENKWTRIFTTERGYGDNQKDGRQFGNELIKATIKISSKNSKIAKKDIWILPEPNSNGKIVSFKQP